jgi:hypothetical protein
VLDLAAKFIPAADEVYRMQNLETGTDPECRLFQKFSEIGHYTRPGTTRQGTYCVTPSGLLLASINSNDPKRIADMMQRSLEKYQTLAKADRLLAYEPSKKWSEIKRPERFYPDDGLVLYVTSRDLPRDPAKAKPSKAAWHELAWNQDYAWFTKVEARGFLAAQPKVGQKHDLPLPVIQRIVCAHLVDNVRGQTSPFEISQVKKARVVSEVTAVDGDLVSMRLEGESFAADEGARKHGLDMRLLGKATYNLKSERFVSFELVAIGKRWGGTQNNSRKNDLDEAPIGLVFTLAGDGHCERVAPAFNHHRVYGAVVGK